MSAPLVSVVIPTLNAMPQLRSAISALELQTFKDFELVIQDGGSTDGTLDFLCSKSDRFQLEIQSTPDNGIGPAYNRGMQRAKGKFVLLSAADEELFPFSLELGLNWHRRYPECIFIYGSELLQNMRGEIFIMTKL
jgi:glycosyltransferase involved in cell wall biosynthesis